MKFQFFFSSVELFVKQSFSVYNSGVKLMRSRTWAACELDHSLLDLAHGAFWCTHQSYCATSGHRSQWCCCLLPYCRFPCQMAIASPKLDVGVGVVNPLGAGCISRAALGAVVRSSTGWLQRWTIWIERSLVDTMTHLCGLDLAPGSYVWYSSCRALTWALGDPNSIPCFAKDFRLDPQKGLDTLPVNVAATQATNSIKISGLDR